jgi:sialate O-acetylesterase
VPADARVEGSTVVVSSPQVPEPAAVRYAWENNPDANVVNSAGLPASLFRSDNRDEIVVK